MFCLEVIFWRTFSYFFLGVFCFYEEVFSFGRGVFCFLVEFFLGLQRLNDTKSPHRWIAKQRRYERLAATCQLSLWQTSLTPQAAPQT